jgi:nucleoside 2-deoxyribosyltransferase
VVPKDIEAIDHSKAVIAICDGLDAGTLFEIGYARAKSIPVVAFVQNEKEEDMKMLAGTDCVVTSDFVSALYNIAWEAIA